jgi:hypothetical protein
MTPAQQQAIADVISKLNSYLASLQQAFSAAIAAGDDTSALYLQQRHDEGLSLLKQAVDLQVTSTLPDLTAATATLKAQADQLNSQAAELNKIGAAVGAVANFLTQVANVLAAVATFAALV